MRPLPLTPTLSPQGRGRFAIADHATSTDPAVQAQFDRLARLGPGADVLGLERITRLLARLGDPQRHLPPVLHVAGTNGKGSTCAFVRAAIEAAGLTAHVYTSPHLVRFNERIRLAGSLIDDPPLAALLDEVLRHAEGIGASFFEVTTAVAFLAFARTPADAAIVEVGLGGRLDATNVVPAPLVTGIAALGLDHQAFLGDSLEGIAAEKAGIAKAGVPLVTMDYPSKLARRIATVAAAAGAPVYARGAAWWTETATATMRYRDPGFAVVTDRPRLVGRHQHDNLGLAIAMLRHQGALAIPEAAYRAAADWARWPARLQRLADGPLTAMLPAGSTAWLDGAHNPSAAIPVGKAFRAATRGRPHALILGMLANKDAAKVIAAFAPGVAHFVAVPVAGHEHHPPATLAALARERGIASDIAPDLGAACTSLARLAVEKPPAVLVAGSLYLAGEALRLNDELPT